MYIYVTELSFILIKLLSFWHFSHSENKLHGQWISTRDPVWAVWTSKEGQNRHMSEISRMTEWDDASGEFYNVNKIIWLPLCAEDSTLLIIQPSTILYGYISQHSKLTWTLPVDYYGRLQIYANRHAVSGNLSLFSCSSLSCFSPLVLFASTVHNGIFWRFGSTEFKFHLRFFSDSNAIPLWCQQSLSTWIWAPSWRPWRT